jgi:hypothetical protein
MYSWPAGVKVGGAAQHDVKLLVPASLVLGVRLDDDVPGLAADEPGGAERPQAE